MMRYSFVSTWKISNNLSGDGSFAARKREYGDVPDNVVAVQLLEQTDFPDSGAGNALVFAFEADLLHRHDSVRLVVARLVYDTICPCRARL